VSKVLMVAHDTAPSNAFELLKEHLIGSDVDTRALFGSGGPLPVSLEQIEEEARSAGIVLIGMSHPEANTKEEVAAAVAARDAGVPFGFYADTYGAHTRVNPELLRQASVLFVINEEEAADARSRHPGVDAVVSGNPEWETFFFPNYSRSEVRNLLGVSADETLVLVGGDKTPVANCLLWNMVAEAMFDFPEPRRMVIAPHPGDTTARDVYNEILNFPDLDVRMVTRDDDGLSTGDMIPGADLFVSLCSTMDIAAACSGVPVIDLLTGRIALDTVETAFGSRNGWPLPTLGVSREIVGDDGYRNLGRTMKGLLDESGEVRQWMLRRQAEVYPKPHERGTAVRIMGKTLHQFTS